MPAPGLPRPAFSYNMGAVRLVIGSVPISNYGPDGSIDFEFPSALVESELSADGYVTYVVQNDERLRCTIRISEKSGALPLLQALWTAQQAAMYAGGLVAPLIFAMVCPSTGDIVQSEYCVFLNTPTTSKTKGLSTREYQVELPGGRYRALVGTLNIPTP